MAVPDVSYDEEFEADCSNDGEVDDTEAGAGVEMPNNDDDDDDDDADDGEL
jgi:hypothetical protein